MSNSKKGVQRPSWVTGSTFYYRLIVINNIVCPGHPAGMVVVWNIMEQTINQLIIIITTFIFRALGYSICYQLLIRRTWAHLKFLIIWLDSHTFFATLRLSNLIFMKIYIKFIIQVTMVLWRLPVDWLKFQL